MQNMGGIMTDKKTEKLEDKSALLILYISPNSQRKHGDCAYPNSVQKIFRFRLIMFNTYTAWLRSLLHLVETRSAAFMADEVDKNFSDYQPCMWLTIIK
jgi:hypothetical protein